ncbi:phospholipase D-like domain-containing protein [Candidatus Carsonella ruddii]|uniref:phospholipase D-like domain-containing protein n=1 Tax=Carsonella ruddii TaxID=114186 RepID=UPI0039C88CD4
MIISPYIILDLKLIFFLKKNKNKYDIFIYLSYKTDNLYIQNSSFIFIKILKKYKINIFFLKKGFFHRKIYIIEKFFFFGSNNFDNRSIYINKECFFCFFSKSIKKIFLKKIKNFLFIYNNIKKFFFIKFIYIISFLNYFFQ